jgi:Icc protein
MTNNNEHLQSRRTFIKNTTAAGLLLSIPAWAQAAVGRNNQQLRLGLITDLHHDIMHDGMDRMQAFVKAMDKNKPDAVMQLGDFAYPNEKNKPVIDLCNKCNETSLHVIGNHDTDSGYTHAQCMEYWGIPAPYYSKNTNGFTVVVLNGNDKGSPTHKGGYPAYIGDAQRTWLSAQLASATQPVIIVCHQPLTGVLAVDNAAEIQQLITSAKSKVVLVLNGHTHIDSLLYVSEIPYLTINSASYFWVGQNFIHNSYSDDIHQSHPWISRTCPYTEPLFTTLTINPRKMTIKLEGKKGEWQGKSPKELSYNEMQPLQLDEEIVPFIRKRKVLLKQEQINFDTLKSNG